MSRIIFLVGLALWGFKTASASCDLQKVFPQLNYVPKSDNMVFPCESTKNIYLQTKRYDPKSILITRAQIDQVKTWGNVKSLKNFFLNLFFSVERSLCLHPSLETWSAVQFGKNDTD